MQRWTKAARGARVVTLDFSDTLAHIVGSVGAHYASVLAKADGGLSGLEAAERVKEVDAAFVAAFKATDAAYPNFGSAAGLDHDGWWREVVEGTFDRAVGRDGDERARIDAVLETEFGALVDHFTSDEAYALFPDVRRALGELRTLRVPGSDEPYLVGLITNQTSRISDTLAALRLDHLLDFVVNSHSVGVAKPHPDIFAHALDVAGILPPSPDDVVAIHIGDDVDADVGGAAAAPGYIGLHLDRRGGSPVDQAFVITTLDDVVAGLRSL